MASRWTKFDSREMKLLPGEGIEIKYNMKKGAALVAIEAPDRQEGAQAAEDPIALAPPGERPSAGPDQSRRDPSPSSPRRTPSKDARVRRTARSWRSTRASRPAMRRWRV